VVELSVDDSILQEHARPASSLAWGAMTTEGRLLYSDRLRGRAGWMKARTRRELAPRLIALGDRLGGTTTARLEYPFEPSVRWGWGQSPHQGLVDLFSAGIPHYRQVLGELMAFLPDLSRIARVPSAAGPGWDNDYWSSLDPVRQYGAIVSRKPATYMEVGSGNSTLFARQAIRDHDLSTRIVSIDPAPRADIDPKCDIVYRSSLEHLDLTVFDQLQAGDILLMDGAHTTFMGSDAVVGILEVLPRLAPGVLVGIHDIFLPWDYPPDWVKRWYGEQYLVAAFLLGRPAGWRIDFPTWYVARATDLTDDLDDLWAMIGDPPGRTGSSIWIERVA
jgi:hypothetical protein